MTTAHDAPPSPGAPADPAGPPAGPPASRRARAAIMVGCTVLTTVLAAVGTLLVVQSHLAGQVDRVDGVFTGLEDRPPRPSSGPAADSMNILVMGTDRRADGLTTGTEADLEGWIPGAGRSDVMMLVHVDGDRAGASVVAFPRDSWVDVPGWGSHKINAAYSYGGPRLAVHTVEELTGLRVDHVAITDWTGYGSIIDAVGGVTVTVPRTVTDTRHDVVWAQGRQTLDGRQALLYVRQRYGLPGGDLDRIRRELAVARNLARGALRELGGPAPWDVYDLLDTVTRNVTVDSGWEVSDMRALLTELRGMTSDDITYLSAPVSGLGREGAESVVYLDRARADTLWEALRTDTVEAWAARHPELTTVGPVL
ncbi:MULTISPECIES: LCP family protein [unclassified Nocardioides]|uniref:LCP family protein n=1 Tax=unclassified Nocardioides TaxID=2615069 RepID=UPI0009EA2821|nr:MULTISPECIES: LCP family protein [unclassified Nocardioides]